MLLLFLASLFGMSSQASFPWSYDYETQWPGECNTGQLQSPINIMSRETVLDKHEAHIRGPLVLRGYSNVLLSAENNGHTLQWNTLIDKPGSAPAPTLSGGPLRGNYTFMQFHLHWLSEHAIDGMKYPLEIHMVHIKTGLRVEEALKRPDGLAVVGILAQVRSDEASLQTLAEIMPVVPELQQATHRPSELMDVNLLRLLSLQPQSYYTYHGSLTTPTCDEVVTWIVMNVPISISDIHYKEFSKVDVGGIDNYRSLQRVNRVVYRSMASCSSILVPGLLGSISGILSCLSSSLNASFMEGARKSMCMIWNAKRKLSGQALKECQD